MRWRSPPRARVVVNDIGVGLDGVARVAAAVPRRASSTRSPPPVAKPSPVAPTSRLGAGRGPDPDRRRLVRRAGRSGQQRRHRPRPDVRQHQRRGVRRRHRRAPQGPLRHHAARGRLLASASRRRATLADARIINTSSGAGLQGSVGQANYSAAKAGIAAMTLVASAEMGRYGVTVAPSPRRRAPG